MIKFPVRKLAIWGKLKEIKGLRGDLRMVRRTRNHADWRRDRSKGPFPCGNYL